MSRFSDNVHELSAKATPIINIPVVREDMTNGFSSIDCSLPENENNPECVGPAVIDNSLLIILIASIIITIVMYIIMIFAAVKTKNHNLKIFLILSILLPFLAPIGIIIALLIITNVI